MGRPTSPLITRSATVAATLALLEREGLEGFSLRRLAAEMGVNQASLYYHFEGGRAEILSAAARMTLAELELPEPGEDWVEWMCSVAIVYRRLLVNRPFLIDVVVSGYRPRTAVVAFGESNLAAAGVSEEYHQPILDALESMTVGSALASVARRRVKGPAAKATKAVQARAADVEEHLLRVSHRALLEAVIKDPTLVVVNSATISRNPRRRPLTP